MSHPGTAFAATTRHQNGGGAMIFDPTPFVLGGAFVCLVGRAALLAAWPQPPSTADLLSWLAFAGMLWGAYWWFARDRRARLAELRRLDKAAEAVETPTFKEQIAQLELTVAGLKEELSEMRRKHAVCEDEIARIKRMYGGGSWIVRQNPPGPS